VTEMTAELKMKKEQVKSDSMQERRHKDTEE